MSKKIFLSIITVTYNDFEGFFKTYNSIKHLLNENIEWIIKDGGSDNSIIKSIENLLVNKKIKFISSLDNGTYNAMNTALNSASGDWLIFMNGGDKFCDFNFLEKIIFFIKSNNLKAFENNIICGNYFLSYKTGQKTFVKYRNIYECIGIHSYRMPTCHQAQLFSKSLYSKLRFRENLKISADHAFFLGCN